MLSRDGLALSPGLFPRSALCLPTCLHLSPRLFSHTLAGLDAVTRWSGSVSPLSPHLFAFVSPLVSSRCHKIVWLGQPFVAPLVSICLPACFLTRLLGWMLSRDGLARSALCLPTFSFCLRACFLTRLLGWMISSSWSGSVSSLSPRLLSHLLGWMLSQDGPARSALCLPTCFLTRLLGWMLSRDGLAQSALCLPLFFLSPRWFPHALAGLDAVTRWSDSAAGCCCGCCCRVLLQGETQTCPGCCCRKLLQACCQVLPQAGTHAGCCCRSRRRDVQGAAAG